MQIVLRACLEIIKMRASKSETEVAFVVVVDALHFSIRITQHLFPIQITCPVCRAERQKIKLHRTADAAAHAAAGAADIIYQIYELLMPLTNTGASFSSALFQRCESAFSTPKLFISERAKLRPATTFQSELVAQKQYFPALFLHQQVKITRFHPCSGEKDIIGFAIGDSIFLFSLSSLDS